MEQRHIPVLLDRCVELLSPALGAPDAVLVDVTLGMGGHSEAMLERHPHLRVVGLDRDPQAIAMASARLARFADRFTAVHAVYDDVLEVVEDVVGRPVQGLLADLGVSSLQLDEADRGFAYAQDAPLDMRMDPSVGPSAADLLASADERELTRILRAYGEERFAARIAARIVRARRTAPLTRTGELVDVVRAAIPAAASVDRRPPRQAHVPGAADPGQRRARGARARAARRRRDAGRGRPDRRHGVPLARGPPGQARARAGRRRPAHRPGCRSSPRPTGPTWSCSPAAPRPPPRPRPPPTRGRRPCGCAPRAGFVRRRTTCAP